MSVEHLGLEHNVCIWLVHSFSIIFNNNVNSKSLYNIAPKHKRGIIKLAHTVFYIKKYSMYEFKV